MNDFSSFFKDCECAPRLTDLAQFFSTTALGTANAPLTNPQVDKRLLERDPLLNGFLSLHEKRRGPFDQHYHASIPYRLEEECRLGHAIFKYSSQSSQPITVYSLGTAEGTMARTLSEISDGNIITLSCSPNEENYASFRSFGETPHAAFFLGPFHRLTSDERNSNKELARFKHGFDIIFEDTTFQMYSPNRSDQIRFVSQHLKPGGLFFFVEKFKHIDEEEYHRREQQKDFGFKSRYFQLSDIGEKKKIVLNLMEKNQVTLQKMRNSIEDHFRYCYLIWNSGNFSTLLASNSRENAARFLSCLMEPAIPLEYVYEALPVPLGSI